MKILACRLPELQTKIIKFNKKATKWNLPLVTMEIGPVEVEERTDNDNGDAYFVEVVKVDIVGDVPKIQGWSVHSRIEPSEVKGQNYVFTNPNQPHAISLKNKEMFCDHCQTRRLKKVAYFIQNEDGHEMLVGATCLQDFLPSCNIESLLSYMNDFHKISDIDEERVPRDQWVYPTTIAIQESYLSIKKFGFVSKTKMIEEQNKNNFVRMTAADIDASKEIKKSLWDDVDIDELNKSLESFIPHMMAKNATGNDFIGNVQIALQSEAIKPKLFGYIAAAVNTWLKDNEKAAQDTTVKSNEYFGTIGQRYMIKGLRITRLTPIEGQWGTTLVYGFVDEEGNAYAWFSTKDVGEVNEVVNLKGTIKNHQEYMGRKQTILTRCTPF
jgi:hypothetical protein